MAATISSFSSVSKTLAKDFGPDASAANYAFPTALKTNAQDYIRFTAFKYTGGTIPTAASTVVPSPVASTNLSSPQGTVALPIQSGISDSNMVSWGQDELNAIDSSVAAAAYNSIYQPNSGSKPGAEEYNGLSNLFGTTLKFAGEAATLANTEERKKAIALYFAGRAANVNNLLARAEGKVLNPNMELLFQGPSLRPFTFAFRLSPRDTEEAKEIKDIIRFFKIRMAPIIGGGSLFLEAPHIFQIQYIDGNVDSGHASLNRIKLCALQTCNVDYTPDGNYATFKDGAMTSYGLSLQFTELEPVYSSDYKDLKNGEIGF